MNYSFVDHHRTSKTFIACLIITLLTLSPLAPLASAAPTPTKRVESASTTAPDPAAPLVPAITATKTDSFPDPDMDGKAAPGETITYDVNITNNGTDATGVNFSDMIDGNTTLVPGSLKVSPLAFPDIYGGAKDTQLVVAAPGVLMNDTGVPAPTAVPIAGGATTVNQYLAAGLIDELRLHVTPCILGAGERVFDGVPAQPLERVSVRAASRVTHITYRPVRS